MGLKEVMIAAATADATTATDEAPARGRPRAVRAKPGPKPGVQPAPPEAKVFRMCNRGRGKISTGDITGAWQLLAPGDCCLVSASRRLIAERSAYAAFLQFTPAEDIEAEVQRIGTLRSDALVAAIGSCADLDILRRAYARAADTGASEVDLRAVQVRLDELVEAQDEGRQNADFLAAAAMPDPRSLKPLLDLCEDPETVAGFLRIARNLPGPAGKLRAALCQVRLAELRSELAAAGRAAEEAQEALIAARENARGTDAATD